jgi:hypothetical protein
MADMIHCTMSRAPTPQLKMQAARAPPLNRANNIAHEKKGDDSVEPSANASKTAADEFALKSPKSGPVPLVRQTGLTKAVDLRKAPLAQYHW